MARTWELQEAKSQFSEMIEAALRHEPQIIIQQGAAKAIVLAYADYHKILINQQPLSAFFRESPLVGVELDLTRDASATRGEIAL